jgi:hypothetical protein
MKSYFDLQKEDDLSEFASIVTKNAKSVEEIQSIRNSVKHLQFFKRIEEEL